MKCPYCGREMKSSKDKAFGLFPMCTGGSFSNHEAILWSGDDFRTKSKAVACELSNRGFHVRKVEDEYDISPQRSKRSGT